MTITEAINKVKEDKEFTDDNIGLLRESVLKANITGYDDPNLKEFINFVNSKGYDKRIDNIVDSIISALTDKGIPFPCASGCGSGCAFHEAEFGN